jgi:hypothetical protein
MYIYIEYVFYSLNLYIYKPIFVLAQIPLAPKGCLATFQRSGGRIYALHHLWAGCVVACGRKSWERLDVTRKNEAFTKKNGGFN